MGSHVLLWDTHVMTAYANLPSEPACALAASRRQASSLAGASAGYPPVRRSDLAVFIPG